MPGPSEMARQEAEPIEQTLAERGSRYGDFTDHAHVADDIIRLMSCRPNWAKMPPYQRQALRVIADKIGRMMTGDHSYIDNWHDIVGYAKLVEDRLKAGGS